MLRRDLLKTGLAAIFGATGYSAHAPPYKQDDRFKHLPTVVDGVTLESYRNELTGSQVIRARTDVNGVEYGVERCFDDREKDQSGESAVIRLVVDDLLQSVREDKRWAKRKASS